MPPTFAAELIAPNLHVALIHYPLAMLAVGVLTELFGFLWPRSTVRTAGRWMILIGALSAIPAAFSGIYALRAVARVDMGIDHPWADVRAASPVLSDPAVWHALRNHTLYQSIATGVAVLAAVVYLGAGDAARRALQAPVMALLVLSIGGMMAGAWLGGEAIYKHGTGVDRGWPPTPADAAAPSPTRIEQLFPPVELHVVLAGVTVAIAVAAIGLSFRRLAMSVAPPVSTHHEDYAATDLARSFNPNLEVTAVVPPLPAGRFWLLAFAVAAATSLGGWFVLARSADVLAQAHGHYQRVPQLLWKQVKPEPPDKVNRLLMHLAVGGTIIVVPLLLAALARWAPRQRVLLAALTLVLVVAVAAQVWFGVLLLYDTPDGPLHHFNPPSGEGAAGTVMAN
jgi:uncharacterized membrane protein